MLFGCACEVILVHSVLFLAITMTEQGVFTRFGAYDFTSDDRFQSGLDKLKEKHKDKVDASWLLKTKLFYYNK